MGIERRVIDEIRGDRKVADSKRLAGTKRPVIIDANAATGIQRRKFNQSSGRFTDKARHLRTQTLHQAVMVLMRVRYQERVDRRFVQGLRIQALDRRQRHVRALALSFFRRRQRCSQVEDDAGSAATFQFNASSADLMATPVYGQNHFGTSSYTLYSILSAKIHFACSLPCQFVFIRVMVCKPAQPALFHRLADNLRLTPRAMLFRNLLCFC